MFLASVGALYGFECTGVFIREHFLEAEAFWFRVDEITRKQGLLGLCDNLTGPEIFRLVRNEPNQHTDDTHLVLGHLFLE